LSDLDPVETGAIAKSWSLVPTKRRQEIMETIVEIGDSDPLLSFESICRCGVRDADPIVRVFAIRTLWDYDLDDLVPAYLKLVTEDDDADVRAAVATALGKFIYLGEIEELPEDTLREIEDRLLTVAKGADVSEVRRRAIESLGFSSRKEVSPLIEEAYYSGKEDWVLSALFAMGRSANNKWARLLVEMLDDDSPEVRAEAVRAVGELEIENSLPRLIELLDDGFDDVRLAAIWSLSQIGGAGVRDILELLYEDTQDEEEAEYIATALENLDFTEDMDIFSFMDFPDDDDLLDLVGDNGDLSD
jgi:HEAT repeat protein